MDRSSAPHKRTATALASSSSSSLHWWSRIPVRINTNKTRAVLIIIIIHWIYNEKCQTNNNHELLIIPVPCVVCRIRTTFNIAVTAFDGGQDQDQDLTDWLRAETWDLPGTYNSPMLQSRLSRRRRRHRLWLQLIMAYPLKWSCRAQKECQRCMLHNAKWSLFVQYLFSPVPHPVLLLHLIHLLYTSPHTQLQQSVGLWVLVWLNDDCVRYYYPIRVQPALSQAGCCCWLTTLTGTPPPSTIRSWRRRCDAMMMKGTWLFTDRSFDRSPFPVHCCCCFSCCGPVLPPPPLMANDLQCHYQHTSKDEKKKLIEVAPPSTPCHFVIIRELFIISCTDRIDRNQSSRGLGRCSFVH